MAKAQQPELHRSGTSPTDPASAKSHAETAPPATEAGTGPVPEDNRPGHHPEQEQDKPIDAFVARTTRRRPPAPTGATPSPRPVAAGKAQEPAANVTPHPRASSPPSSPAPGIDRGALYVIAPALAWADAARRPERAWEDIGESKVRWLAQIALLPGLGPWRYGSSIRPRLQAAERAQDLAGG
jgi:hypothetical protein